MICMMFASVIISVVIISDKTISASPSWKKFYDVENLIAEPDYRAIQLKWNYYHELGLRGFNVLICEIAAWNSKIRCRERYLPLVQTARRLAATSENVNRIDKLVRVNKGTYEAAIYDLRMLTNYSLSVKANFDSSTATFALSVHPAIFYPKHDVANNRPSVNFNDYDELRNSVIVETKGFSARTNRCLANTSDVVVNTGPYFSGKIAVEETNNDVRCSVYGNRSSPQEIYTLTILHDICGSKIINNSRIETMVMVHENREILTHNSRRFLVVCNFVPETFTLKASVAMPPHLLKRKKSEETHKNEEHSNKDKQFPLKPISHTVSEVDLNDRGNDIFTYDNFKQNNVRDSRILAHQQHRVVDTQKSNDDYYWNNFLSTFMFVICAFVFCVIALLWYVTTPQISDKKEPQDIKYISMNSSGINEKISPGNGTAVVKVNGAPVALVALNSLGDSFA